MSRRLPKRVDIILMNSINIQAPAKVNLYLKIIRRRPDGYHELATLMQKVGLYDELQLEKIPSGITLCCPDSDLPEDENNLVFRAARLFFEYFKERNPSTSGVGITLKKKIPIAAGLGGGSSDAAAVLTGLKDLFEIDCSLDELLQLGSRLGADVPFFVNPAPAAWATGIGDQLQQAVAIDDFSVLLVNPGFSVSTKWVYENFQLTKATERDIIRHSASGINGTKSDCVFLHRAILPVELHNDLELVTIDRYDELGLLKEQLLDLGAVCTLMSGSGPTIFALFARNDTKNAEKALDLFACKYGRAYLAKPLIGCEVIQ